MSLLDGLRELSPQELIDLGAGALRQRDQCEAEGTDHGHLRALVYDCLSVLVDRALIEKTTVGGANRPASLADTGTVIAHGSREPRRNLASPVSPGPHTSPPVSSVKTVPHAGKISIPAASQLGTNPADA